MNRMILSNHIVDPVRRKLAALLAVVLVPGPFLLSQPVSAQQFIRVIVTLRNADRDREVQDLFNALSGLEYRLIDAYTDRPVLILDVSDKALRRLRGLPMVAQIVANGGAPLPQGETPKQDGISPMPKGETLVPHPLRPERPPPRPGPQLDRYIVQYDGSPRREIRRIRRAMDGLPFRITRQMDASRMIVVETNARGYRRLQRVEGVRVWRDGLSAPL